MLKRISKLEAKVPRSRSNANWLRFAQIVVDDLPAIRIAAQSVGLTTSAEYHRIAQQIVDWIDHHKTEFIFQSDDLVYRCTSIQRDNVLFADCEKYTLTAAADVIAIIFPSECFEVV